MSDIKAAIFTTIEIFANVAHSGENLKMSPSDITNLSPICAANGAKLSNCLDCPYNQVKEGANFSCVLFDSAEFAEYENAICAQERKNSAEKVIVVLAKSLRNLPN